MSDPDEKPPLVIREEQGLKSGIRPVIDYGTPQKPSTSKYPLSKVCPKCGGTEYKRVRPDAGAAFAYDRVCKACGTRYTPPTPLWAAIVFIVVGVLISFPFGLSLVGNLLLMTKGGNAANPVGLLCPLVITTVGVASIIHGIKALRSL